MRSSYAQVWLLLLSVLSIARAEGPGAVGVPRGAAVAGEAGSPELGGPIDPTPALDRIHFSTEVSFQATGGPHTGQLVSDGDELRPAGVIVHTNQNLAGAFCQQPPFFDVGLDALHHRRNGDILFSSEIGWFDECLGRQISDGDLLRNDGTVERTNAQLMSNFHPMPTVPDVGLDGVHELGFGELLFSIEEDIFDDSLGVVLKHGDVLSEFGYVFATNEHLLRNFCIKPVFPDMGVDGLFLPGNGEIWFSTEEGFFDECGRGQISDGDLLSDAGYVVATQRQLTDGFRGPNDPVVDLLGLDAVWVDLCFPFSGCGTLNAGPQGCPVFLPDGGPNFYFIENTGSFGSGERVWVTGCLNANSTICPPFTAPGIERNTVGLCFEACGTLGPAPHGCNNPLLYTDDGQLYAIENVGDFTFGDRVFVRGRLNNQSVICFPPLNPAIEDNTITDCEACCFADGNCALLPPAACQAAGGLAQGPNSQCGALSCLQACCLDDGTCQDLPPGDCQAQGGRVQGLGTSCDASDIQCPPAAVITSVCSLKVHRPLPGPLFPCCLPISGVIPDELSEPRLTVPNSGASIRGITAIQVTFDRPLNPSAFLLNDAAVRILETTTAIYPLFQPYSGSAAVSTGGAGNVLRLQFTPGLENARAYRMAMTEHLTSAPGQRFDVRGLVGDVNSDGRVNATDRSVVVGVWTGTGFSCETDVNLDAETNATDRSIVVGAWTSGQNRAP